MEMRSTATGYVRGLYIVVKRDLDRFWKYKWWLAGLITMNLTDLFIFALIFNNIVNRAYIDNYLLFLAPGIAAIATFASAFSIGREVGVEVRRGYTQYLLSLPLTRMQLSIGRILGGAVRGLIYQMPFIALLFILHEKLPTLSEAGILAVTSSMLTISMSSLSIVISTAVRSFDLQATMRSFTYFVLFFFSNVFYPDALISRYFPHALYIVISNNPVSIATSIYRNIFTQNTPAEDSVILLLKLAIWCIVLLIMGSIFYLRNLTH
ncbi:MAG: ABC transporter permease [Desulfurococcales archaeon]|jgi:ABC-2 type transport system permease protein|nr:ABC transporter permease [Desulfurococcales archaeon]